MVKLISGRSRQIIGAVLLPAILSLAINIFFLGPGLDPLFKSGELKGVTKVAFAVNEGLLRCTNGKLVGSQDQCPRTDQCPPPQNKTVSNCVLGESLNSTLSELNKNANQSVSETHCYKNRATLHIPQCPVNQTSNISS
jgi:hypothetical protein